MSVEELEGRRARAIAEAVGSFLKVAGDQSRALSDVGLVVIIAADTFKGKFSAEIGRVVCEEEKPAEAPVVAPAVAPAEGPEEAEVKPGEKPGVEKPGLVARLHVRPSLGGFGLDGPGVVV